MYYVTICTYNRQEILSEIIIKIDRNNENDVIPSIENINVKLTGIGKMIEKNIEKILYKYNIPINNYIIMPNHVHMIIEFNFSRADTRPAPTLSEIICEFKSITAREYIIFYKKNGENIKLWQRNYFEHIIRNEKEYLEICKYMEENPIKYYLNKNNII